MLHGEGRFRSTVHENPRVDWVTVLWLGLWYLVIVVVGDLVDALGVGLSGDSSGRSGTGHVD